MTGISREILRAHLHNQPLVAAIAQKKEIQKVKQALIAARVVMGQTCISEAAQKEVCSKIDEYTKISQNYGNMIEDTWGVSWQIESIIAKYIDDLDDVIDQLPEFVKF
ncbi:MAG: hypothetical protein FWF44_06280 [Defluviitaleaceae bacterium]|nr:hypothetical protein [Defluviitaleaceae bacterium]